jgi:Flp pilus assembly protein protease CpaA
MFIIGAIGAGDGKLMFVFLLQFDLKTSLIIIGLCVILGVFIGMIYLFKDGIRGSTVYFLYSRTKFPFQYACFPVFLWFILLKGW